MPSPIAGWFGSRGVAAKPGYSIFLTPWADRSGKTNTGWAGNTQNTSALGGGVSNQATPAQNNEITWDLWFEAGTWKYAQLHSTFTDRGIYDAWLDGIALGSIDGYAAAGPNWNVYTELTGLALGRSLRTFKLKMATKNASSSNYASSLESSAFIRTGA